MPGPLLPHAEEGRRRSRRAVLALGLAVGSLGWTGCTLSDPVVRRTASTPGSTTPTATSGPSAGAGRAAAVDAELLLAAGARNLASRAPGGRQKLLELVEATHRERAAALAAADPASRPTGSPTPDADPDAVPATSAALVRAEQRAARRHRTSALASSGLPALLHGSMAVASTRFAAGLRADEAPAAGRPRDHQPMALVSDSEAVAALVASLHAAVWGYQLALGRLDVGSPAHTRATAGLTARRALLRRLSDRLVAAGVEVPPAAPAYDPSPEVRDAATAARVVRRMESALLPFCGLWLAAAARPADRRSALDTLAATAATAQSWGAPLTAWPGWAD